MIGATPFSQQGFLVQLDVKVCLKYEQARLASILALLHREVNGHLKVEIQIKPHIPHSTFCISDKGSPQNAFSEKVGHLAQPADPPPPCRLGRQKKKKKSLMFILHFRLF